MIGFRLLSADCRLGVFVFEWELRIWATQGKTNGRGETGRAPSGSACAGSIFSVNIIQVNTLRIRT